MTDIKISQLSAISALDDDDVLVVVEDGVTKKVTVAQMRSTLLPSTAITALDADDTIPIFEDGTIKQATLAELELAISPAWTSYVPEILSDTTPPTLGSGSTQAGKYVQIGKLVYGWGTVIFGSSGVAAGSGGFRFTLPVMPTATNVPAGMFWVRDNTGPAKYDFHATTDTVIGTNGSLIGRGTAGTSSDWGGAWPITWAASDQISVFFTYEAA